MDSKKLWFFSIFLCFIASQSAWSFDQVKRDASEKKCEDSLVAAVQPQALDSDRLRMYMIDLNANFRPGESNAYILQFFRHNRNRLSLSQVLVILKSIRNATIYSERPARPLTPFMRKVPVVQEIYASLLEDFPQMSESEKTRVAEIVAHQLV